MKKAVIIGDYTNYSFHPFAGVDKALEETLAGNFASQSTEDYNTFHLENLSRFELCVSYINPKDGAITPRQAAGLLSYVAQGGGLVVLHSGIILNGRPEIVSFLGAKFLHHPPYRLLTFENAAPEHDIMKGIGGFTIADEPYMFEFNSLAGRQVLFRFRLEDTLYDAGWAQKYGLGRVVYLMPGHNLESFKNPVYREIILKSALWAAK